MRNILEELYCGRLNVLDQSFESGSEYARALSDVTQLGEKLRKALSPDERCMLDRYTKACSDLAGMSKMNDFIQGFRIGAQMIMAVLLPDELLKTTTESGTDEQGQSFQ